MSDQVPLIWTKNGNVPVADLEYVKEWKITDKLIIFAEAWKDAAGEVVKNNVHVYAKEGLPSMGVEQAILPGAPQ